MKRMTQAVLIIVCSSVMRIASAEGIFGEEINPNPIVNAPDSQFVQVVYDIFRPSSSGILSSCFDVYLGKQEFRSTVEMCREGFMKKVSSAADDAGIKPPPKPGENQCKYSCNFKLMKYSLDPRIWNRAVTFMKTDPVLAKGYAGITRGALEDPSVFESALKSLVKRYQVK